MYGQQPGLPRADIGCNDEPYDLMTMFAGLRVASHGEKQLDRSQRCVR
jgi:hypothetical protein